MSNPNNWLGAGINFFISANSRENAEQICLAVLRPDGWIIVADVNRGLPTKSNMTADGIPYFDHAPEPEPIARAAKLARARTMAEEISPELNPGSENPPRI